MTKINLLPKDFTIGREALDPTPLILGGALAVVLACASLFAWKQAQIGSMEKRIARVDAKLTELKDKSAKIDALEAEEASIQARLNTLQSLSQLKYRILYPLMFDRLLSIIPENVWFTSFNTALEEEAVVLTWSCVAKDLPDIAQFVENLENSKGVFTKVELTGAISVSGTEEESKRQFGVKCAYNLQEPK